MAVKKCPVGAIAGERKMPHTIDETKCISVARRRAGSMIVGV